MLFLSLLLLACSLCLLIVSDNREGGVFADYEYWFQDLANTLFAMEQHADGRVVRILRRLLGCRFRVVLPTLILDRHVQSVLSLLSLRCVIGT